jgi:hypothetical protein
LFEMLEIPSDSQIRVLLDPVEPGNVKSIFRDVYKGLEQGKVLEGMRSHGDSLLVAIDGKNISLRRRFTVRNVVNGSYGMGRSTIFTAG